MSKCEHKDKKVIGKSTDTTEIQWCPNCGAIEEIRELWNDSDGMYLVEGEGWIFTRMYKDG